MGRRRKGKAVEVKLLIPEQVYFEFERELTSNFSSKPVYGMRSQLITSLIVQWLKGRKLRKTEEEPQLEPTLPNPDNGD